MFLSPTSGGVAVLVADAYQWSIDIKRTFVDITSYGDSQKSYAPEKRADIKGELWAHWIGSDDLLWRAATSIDGCSIALFTSPDAAPVWSGPVWLDYAIAVSVVGAVTIHATFVPARGPLPGAIALFTAAASLAMSTAATLTAPFTLQASSGLRWGVVDAVLGAPGIGAPFVASAAFSVTVTAPDLTSEDTMTLDKDVTLQDVVNTTTETTVYSFTVPGGTLSTNNALRLSLIGDYFNNSGGPDNCNVRVKYGGVTIGIVVSGGMASDVNRRSMRGDMLLSAANSANAQYSRHSWVFGLTGTATAGSGTPLVTAEGVKNNGAIDSTVNQLLEVTFQHGTAHAQISARALAVVLEKL